ncbi:MAG: flippase-like domain-containing protein [Pseudomonadota bacterium]|nr:flippase-like domain-containing protein [Pseudomonadota bacterium]
MRLAASILVLTVIFSLVPLRDVVAAIRNVEPRDWLVALVVFLVGHVVSAAKWQLLADSGAGFPAVLRAHFSGLVANLCLPGVAGGDVVRAGLLYRRVADKRRLAVGSVADRLIDTLGLLLIAAVGLLLALPLFASGIHLLASIGVILAASAVGAIVAVRLYPRLLQRLPTNGRLRRIGEQVGGGVQALLAQPLQLALCLMLSMAVQVAFIAVNIMLAVEAGVEVPVAAWFFAWPLSKLIATLPISAGGLGVREASLAGFLGPFGAAPTAVIATGLLWQTILLAAGLLGGLTLLVSDRVFAPKTNVRPNGT